MSLRIRKRARDGPLFWLLAAVLLARNLLLPNQGLVLQLGAHQASEFEIKAAFLLNFARFVEWPPGDGKITICVLGDDPFGPLLDRTVQGESVRGRRLEVQRIRSLENHACQVVYTRNNLAEAGTGVLTVGEGNRFLEQGGMIAFLLEDRRVRFDINLQAAAAAQIQISSRLLKVARTVKR